MAKAEPAPAPSRPAPPEATSFETPLNLDAVAGAKQENLKRIALALDQALIHGRWSEYHDWLKVGLATELKKGWGFKRANDYDRFLSNPLFHKALLQHSLISRLPDAARRAVTQDSPGRSFYRWLMENPEPLESLLMQLSRDDDLKEVLSIWSSLAAQDAEAQTKYRELALACALVFDRAFTPQWNGQQLSITATERYNFYKLHNEKGNLATRLHRMEARDLVWVVCAPVPQSELEWSLKELNLRQRDWGRTYSMVKYDMEKAVKGASKDPYEMYTLEEILEKGGICGDRAYFSENTARAFGIPATALSGDGPRGGHAWFAWLANENEWSISGRDAGYGAGRTTDPQTRRGITEQEFIRREDRRAISQLGRAKASRFLWLAALSESAGDQDAAAGAIEFALAANPKLSGVWDAKIEHWRAYRRAEPVTAWTAFVDDYKREFRDDPERLAVARKLEEEFIFPRQDTKLTLRELKQDTKRVGSTRNPGGALPAEAGEIAQAVRRQGEVLKTGSSLDPIHQLYHRAIQEHGRDAAVFKRLAEDYFGFVKDSPDERIKACRRLENAYERLVEVRTRDFFSAGAQMGTQALIAKLWREAGDTRRAEKLEKAIQRRDGKAKRDAL